MALDPQEVEADKVLMSPLIFRESGEKSTQY